MSLLWWGTSTQLCGSNVAKNRVNALKSDLSFPGPYVREHPYGYCSSGQHPKFDPLNY